MKQVPEKEDVRVPKTLERLNENTPENNNLTPSSESTAPKIKTWTAKEIAFEWNSSYINNRNDTTRSKKEFVSKEDLKKVLDEIKLKALDKCSPSLDLDITKDCDGYTVKDLIEDYDFMVRRRLGLE